jgi:hypothetical protein
MECAVRRTARMPGRPNGSNLSLVIRAVKSNIFLRNVTGAHIMGPGKHRIRTQGKQTCQCCDCGRDYRSYGEGYVRCSTCTWKRRESRNE